MFSKDIKKSKIEDTTEMGIKEKSDVPSIVASDLRIIGNLFSVGSVEVEGEIEGNVTCEELTIRGNGLVKGDILADTIHIDGEVDGVIRGNSVNISETGRVTGIIKYNTLAIKDGAYIDGQCKNVAKPFKVDISEAETEENKTSKATNKKDKTKKSKTTKAKAEQDNNFDDITENSEFTDNESSDSNINLEDKAA